MKVSVIILNYNTVDLLKDCLTSLIEKTKDIQFEIIVVDNHSQDESVKMIRKEFPEIKLIVNENNYGYSKGNNVGITKAKGDYILLLNSDVVLKENAIKKMADLMDNDPKVGISSCKLVDNHDEIQPTGGFFPNLSRIFAWMLFLDDVPLLSRLFKSYHPHKSWYKRERNQDWVTGAFFLIRKKVIKEIGLLDENIFMYTEEMEYCYRAKLKGWEIKYSPITQIVHFGGMSGTSKNALVGEFKGLEYFYLKHGSSLQLYLLKFLLKLGSLLRIILFAIIKPKSGLINIYVEAFRTI